MQSHTQSDSTCQVGHHTRNHQKEDEEDFSEALLTIELLALLLQFALAAKLDGSGWTWSEKLNPRRRLGAVSASAFIILAVVQLTG